MKSRIAVLVGLLMVSVCLFAIARQQTPTPSSPGAGTGLPVIAIQEVETDSRETYAMMIAENNKTMKEKFGLDNYIKLAVGESAGPDSGKVFAITTADSFAKLASNWQGFEQEIALVRSRADLNQIRKLGSHVTYKAVRFDGRNENWFVYNTKAMVSDEAGYLAALDELKALFDAHDFKDAKINCYRVVSGRTDFTHLVSINCPSRERRAALMDAISTEPWAMNWIAQAAKYRTVVANGTYRQLSH